MNKNHQATMMKIQRLSLEEEGFCVLQFPSSSCLVLPDELPSVEKALKVSGFNQVYCQIKTVKNIGFYKFRNINVSIFQFCIQMSYKLMRYEPAVQTDGCDS
jgi:hypothetical protein